MSSDEFGFSDYLAMLRSRIHDRCQDLADQELEVPAVRFREEVFTEVVLETLEDLGQIADGTVCYFDQKIGRAIAKSNGWYVDEENSQIDLFTTIYRDGASEPGSVTGTDLKQAVKRACHVLYVARNGYHTRMEPASSAFDMMQRLHEVQPVVDRLRVIVIADGIAGDIGELDYAPDGLELQTDVWDLRRLFRAASSGVPYEPVEIDIVKRLGRPLSCLPMPSNGADCKSYLTIIPGDLLHSLYHEFGARLLELNVRSFLQVRGKVNKGIRDTLRNEPERFLAYNNGISLTAEDVKFTSEPGGTLAIRSITGLQIVNGGQTVASIHRAKEYEKLDLSDVSVQAKLSIVRPEHIETLVPLISRYANTQNKVNEADFSANHPFHVKIQQLSQTIWSPGEQNRWFYERARGQYQVAKAREGTTKARRKRFEATNPSRQRFDKIQLAKYENAWAQLPHIVSRGSQKNFVYFMDRLARTKKANWEPGADYYHELVAKAIVYKRAEKIARMHKFPAYRANAIAYTVALASYRTAGRVDLSRVWSNQDTSRALADTMYDWMLDIFDEIVVSAGERNVTEWCKKEECWRHIQTLDVRVPEELQDELAEGQPLPTVGDSAGKAGSNLKPEDRENIARVMQVEPEEWVYICGWGYRTGNLEPWQISIATTLASYAATDWSRVPSRKQASQGVRILRTADDEDGRLTGLESG